jgi:hypothetical protein
VGKRLRRVQVGHFVFGMPLWRLREDIAGDRNVRLSYTFERSCLADGIE